MDRRSPTGARTRYTPHATTTSSAGIRSMLAMPRRNTPSDPTIARTVPAASPCPANPEGTAKAPTDSAAISRIAIPAPRLALRVERPRCCVGRAGGGSPAMCRAAVWMVICVPLAGGLGARAARQASVDATYAVRVGVRRTLDVRCTLVNGVMGCHVGRQVRHWREPEMVEQADIRGEPRLPLS